jgi:GrpB-like predicted nucleotidyltransferase (UPF0157 family)
VSATAVVIVAYDPEWPRCFEAERALLERLVGPWLEGGIHHIGSTSIPGLAAKPVIDIMAGVCDLEQARAAFAPLTAAGYEYTPHRPRTHHFSKGAAPAYTHGLHLTEPGSDLWLERIAFRDALRSSPELAAEYAELKLRLVRDPGTYTVSKRPFVARVLAGARIALPSVSPR